MAKTLRVYNGTKQVLGVPGAWQDAVSGSSLTVQPGGEATIDLKLPDDQIAAFAARLERYGIKHARDVEEDFEDFTGIAYMIVDKKPPDDQQPAQVEPAKAEADVRSLKAAFLAAAIAASPAAAQTIGGNASLAVSGTSSNVELPQATNGPTGFPALLIEYAQVATPAQEIFYALGAANTVAAVVPSLPTTQGSPALPPNGICVFPGPNNWVAGITATSTATLRLTQLTTCPPR